MLLSQMSCWTIHQIALNSSDCSCCPSHKLMITSHPNCLKAGNVKQEVQLGFFGPKCSLSGGKTEVLKGKRLTRSKTNRSQD